MTKLLGFEFEIQYRTGLENRAAYALSRIEPTIHALTLSTPKVLSWMTLKRQWKKDEELGQIFSCLKAGTKTKPCYSLVVGKLCYKGQLVLPHYSQFQEIMLKECHDSSVGGHSGFLKTYRRIAQEVYWKNMKKDIRDYVARCAVCQQNKYMTLSPQGYYNHFQFQT